MTASKTARQRMEERLAKLNSQQQAHNQGSGDDFVPSEFYMNIGYIATIDGEERFVTVKGLPADVLKRRPERFGEMAAIANEELDLIDGYKDILEPGEGITLEHLQVQIFRVAQPETSSVSAENKKTLNSAQAKLAKLRAERLAATA